MRLIRFVVVVVVLTGCSGERVATVPPLPQLEAVPVTPSLSELEFRVALAPALIVHSSGCLALFDQDAAQVVCIDPATGTTRRFGRAGAGPGEFSVGSIVQMAAAPDGGLIVFDPVDSRRFTLITPQWQLGRTVNVGHDLRGIFGPSRDSVMSIGGTFFREIVAVSLRDGGIAVHFSPVAPDTGLFKGPNEFDFFGFWVVPRRAGGWHVASPYQETILVEDDRGNVQSRFGRDVPRELPTEREVKSAEQLMRRGNPGRNIDGVMRRIRANPNFAIQRAPAEDGEDRLWVPTGRMRSDSTELDVFDASGRFLGTRRVPGNVHAFTIHGADMYLLVEYVAGEHDGAQGVLRYRIK